MIPHAPLPSNDDSFKLLTLLVKKSEKKINFMEVSKIKLHYCNL